LDLLGLPLVCGWERKPDKAHLFW